MLAAERQRAIVTFLQTEQVATVADLSQRLSVSANTIRRDLHALERSGRVTVVHGGVLSNEIRETEIPFPKRQVSGVNEKKLIGQRAAQLIADGDAIILDAGTTTHEIARALRCRADLTVVTNALNVAQELAECAGIVTVVCGGIVRGRSNCLIGETAERAIGGWHVATAFISVGGVHLDAGLTNPNPFEAPIKQAMIRAATRVVLVATSDKFGRRSLAPFAPLSVVHTIVTDDGLPAEMGEAIRERGIELIIAGAGYDDRLAAQEQL